MATTYGFSLLDNEYFNYFYMTIPCSTPLLVALFIVTVIAVKLVKIFSWPEAPKVYFFENAKNSFLQVYRQCSQLQTQYVPPFLWGRNGHLQTAFYGILGHASLFRTADKRHCVRLFDGTTVTFDVFEPLIEHQTGMTCNLPCCVVQKNI
uniref:Cytochrome P450 n=1 Tax=Romanomermis culicivorax TaxID=13658 RepID=A0A915JHK9_ROMCU